MISYIVAAGVTCQLSRGSIKKNSVKTYYKIRYVETKHKKVDAYCMRPDGVICM